MNYNNLFSLVQRLLVNFLEDLFKNVKNTLLVFSLITLICASTWSEKYFIKNYSNAFLGFIILTTIQIIYYYETEIKENTLNLSFKFDKFLLIIFCILSINTYLIITHYLT